MFHVIVVCLLLVGLGGFGDVVVISVNVWCLLVCVGGCVDYLPLCTL